jgi:hypothetical protein
MDQFMAGTSEEALKEIRRISHASPGR